MKEEPKFDDAAEAPLPRGATVSDPLAGAAAAAPAAAFPVDAIELAKQRAQEIALALFHPRPLTAIATLAEESQYPKRKFDDAADAPLPRTAFDPLAAAAVSDAIELAKQRAHEIALALFLPRPPTAVAPLQTLASTAEESQYPKRKFDDAPLPRGATGSDPLSAAAAPAAAIPVDEIELVKQQAREIASRVFITAEAKRPRVENGAGGVEETKGFGSTAPDFGSATTTGTAEQQYLEMQLFEGIQGTQEFTQWPQNQGLSRSL